MTIQDVLKDIDALCKRCDDATDDIVLSRLSRDDAKAAHVRWKMESLIVACHQELSFLRDYIEQNIVNYDEDTEHGGGDTSQAV